MWYGAKHLNELVDGGAVYHQLELQEHIQQHNDAAAAKKAADNLNLKELQYYMAIRLFLFCVTF